MLLNRVTNQVRSVKFIENELPKLNNWVEQWRVTFNFNKAYYMCITNKKHCPALKPIILQDTVNNEIDKQENLGVTIINQFKLEAPHNQNQHRGK